jgi:hypothetical protein
MKSETMVCQAPVYEAAFGDGPPGAAAAPAPVRYPRWRRAQFLLEQILRTTLRMTLGMARRTPRRLLLCESLPLGERRFVAVVEFERARFLVGGTSASLVLLARLGDGSEEKERALARVADPAREPSGGAQR